MYILYTNVNTTLETDWLNEANGWMSQGFTVPTSLPNAESARLVRKKRFPAGRIALAGNGSQASLSSMYHVVVKPITGELIDKLTVASGQTYEVFELSSGAQLYTDRNFTVGAPLPEELEGHPAIRSANDDKFSSTGNPTFLQFDVNQDVDVYILYTNVNTTLETDWLNEANGWMSQGFTVPTSLPNAESARLVRKKRFPAGRIALAGNGSQASLSSMYHVVAVPVQLKVCRMPNKEISEQGHNVVVIDEFVVNQSGNLIDLDVELDITHSYVGDLVLTLEHEGVSASPTLLSRAGHGGCGEDNIKVTLDDAASSSVQDACDIDSPAIKGRLKRRSYSVSFKAKN